MVENLSEKDQALNFFLNLEILNFEKHAYTKLRLFPLLYIHHFEYHKFSSKNI